MFYLLIRHVVVKVAELEDSKKKYKSNVVFGGHSVKDEFGMVVVFADQGPGATFQTS